MSAHNSAFLYLVTNATIFDIYFIYRYSMEVEKEKIYNMNIYNIYNMKNNGAYLRAHILYIPPDRTIQMIFQSIKHNHLRRPGMHNY